MQQIKVLIVDDSAFMRQLLKDVLCSSEFIKVVGTARDGASAINKIKEYRPDVVTIDIALPAMDGLYLLKRIAEECPTPVIVISGSNDKNNEKTSKNFSYGASDFVIKDDFKNINIETLKQELTDKIMLVVKKPFTDNKIEKEKSLLSLIHTKAEIVIIGTSTGGPKALLEVIPKLPVDIPIPVIVVQHMPLYFTTSLAKRLNKISQLPVKEAEEGDKLKGGMVFIAKGDNHLLIGDDKTIKFNKEPPYWGVRPSMSKTLFSAVNVYGSKILTVVLTGMGKDGSDGVSAIKKLGGKCIVQDEATCTVFGMPKAVIDDGNADKIVPLNNISKEIINMLAYWQ